MPAHLGKSLVARRSNWDYTGKEEQKGDITGTRTWAAPAGLLFIYFYVFVLTTPSEGNYDVPVYCFLLRL